MCDSCGCDTAQQTTFRKPGAHGHTHGTHGHHHDHGGRTIQVEKKVLAVNDELAERNRLFFRQRGILALNLVSSPGSGKTTLLERTITELKDDVPMAVVEGDQQTMHDAERIDATGAEVVQVNTGAGCHLDAGMIEHAVTRLSLARNSILFIENVGNLVCPAMFDLGEKAKVVIISVTEGEDKPQKYPHMFHAADLCLINKIDLLPHLDFDVQKCRTYAMQVNPRLEIIEVSAGKGEGMAAWYQWLATQRRAAGI